MGSTLNLHLLRIFHAVARERSFSRAAEALFVSQPAVSKGVQQLERQLGLPLVERAPEGTRGRKLRLTEAGEALFEHARGLFALETAALQDMRSRAGLTRGRLAVGASTTVAAYWLPPYLAALAREQASIGLSLQVGNTEAIARAVLECAVDLAVVEGEVSDARIVATHWRDDPLHVAVPPGSPLNASRAPGAAALSAQTWLWREPGSGTRAVAEQLLRARRITPVRVIELGSNESIARAVAAGMGIAILPVRLTAELVALKAIGSLELESRLLLRPLYLLQLKDRRPSPLVRAACELLARDHGG
jgi:LysR family transcriptional regulator, transcriptional activator of the cysJI operon